MSILHLLNQALTIQTMGVSTTDAYGTLVPGALGAPVAVLGFLEQQTTTEDLLNRDTTKTIWQAFLPAGTVIGHLDYINFNAQKFQVDGSPWAVWNPRTQLVSHIVCKLVVIEG